MPLEYARNKKTIDAGLSASDNRQNIKSWVDAHTNLPSLATQDPGQGGPAMWPLAGKPVATKPENASTRPLSANDELLRCGFFIAQNLLPSWIERLLMVGSASTHVRRTGVDLILIAGPACCESAKAQEAPWPQLQGQYPPTPSMPTSLGAFSQNPELASGSIHHQASANRPPSPARSSWTRSGTASIAPDPYQQMRSAGSHRACLLHTGLHGPMQKPHGLLQSNTRLLAAVSTFGAPHKT